MASYADPLVQDRWDSHDFDGDPDRYPCLYNMPDEFDSHALATPDPRVTTSVDMGDAIASETGMPNFTPVEFEKMDSPFDGGSSDDGGYPPPPLLTSTRRRRPPVLSLLRKSPYLASIACGDCHRDRIASCSLSFEEEMASVQLLGLATMKEDPYLLDFVVSVSDSTHDALIASLDSTALDSTQTCRQVSLRKPDGVMQLLSVAV